MPWGHTVRAGPVLGSHHLPVAAVSLTQSPHTQSCPGNRAALCGVMGPGAPVPAHKEPLDVPAPHSPEAEVPSHPPSAF